ncbi:MAG: protein HflC [marine bacterium B5-7]|nr:MAG: protein HflC [marine bacterium B5-7]
MGAKGVISLIIVAVLVVVGLMSVFVVDERERAVVFRFGEIVQADPREGNPGLRFKKPFINNVRKFDARVQTLDADPQLFLTVEKKNLLVDSFVKWRVTDVYLYYTKLQGNKSNARNRLGQRVNDSLRQEFGRRTVKNVVSGDRVEIMDLVREQVNKEMEGLGVEVLDVRLKRVDLDPEVSERVYARMEAERSRVAKELRAEGSELAEQIRADADRQRAILLAEARKQSEQIRGQGDAQATAIYAKAFGQDRDFYQFYRSLAAYDNTFSDPSNLLVVEPDSEFFKFFRQSNPERALPASGSNQ